MKIFEGTSGGFGHKHLEETNDFRHTGIILQKDDGTTVRYRNSRQIYLEGLNKWKGWYCSGGINSYFVDEIGDVYVGQCRIGKFANINDEQYELRDEPILCTRDSCNCTQDILETSKEKK